MHILIIKTSSLGDIIHTLPAVCDAYQAIPSLKIDWLIEEQFLNVIQDHPMVNQTIPCHWRSFKKRSLQYVRSTQWKTLKQQLQSTHYDAIIDLQGLLKSALLLKLCKSKQTHGYGWRSCREPLASLFYHHRYSVDRHQNAITRTRQLMAQALQYPCPTTTPQYHWAQQSQPNNTQPILFFTNTTWVTKYWPRHHWVTLGKQLIRDGYTPTLPWGSPQEHAFATALAQDMPGAHVLPKTSITELQTIIANASGFVGVDTGLTHLATAIGCPGVCLMGATDPKLTGPLGDNTVIEHVGLACSPCKRRQCQHTDYKPNQPPCMQAIAPNTVIKLLLQQIEQQTASHQPTELN